MNTRRSTPNFWHTLAALLSLFGLLLGACSATPTATTAAPTAALTQPPSTPPLSEAEGATPVPPTLADIAEEIAADAGAVMQVVDTESEAAIYLFEERHDSPLGQIEIAIMLNRLYTDYEMRHIGLEGLPADEGPLDLAWAHGGPDYQPDQMITTREDVMTQTLQDSIIGGAELLGLIYSDVVVDGIDDAELYAFDPPAAAWDAPDFYLYNIALAGMSETERTDWNSLYDNEQYADAFAFALDVNDFAGKMQARMSDPVAILSAEGWLAALDELQTQAEAVDAELRPEDETNLAALREYFEHISARSDVMAVEALTLAASHPQAALAISVGALHTARMAALLGESNLSFVVLRPQSLAEGRSPAETSQPERPELSVAPAGALRGKMPPPLSVTSTYRYEVETRDVLQQSTERVADLAVAGYSVEDIQADLNTALDGYYDVVDGSGDLYFPIIETVNVTPSDENNHYFELDWVIQPYHPETGASTEIINLTTHLGEDMTPTDEPSIPNAEWVPVTPRVSLTYDITGDGKNVVKLPPAQYMGQCGDAISSSYASWNLDARLACAQEKLPSYWHLRLGYEKEFAISPNAISTIVIDWWNICSNTEIAQELRLTPEEHEQWIKGKMWIPSIFQFGVRVNF